MTGSPGRGSQIWGVSFFLTNLTGSGRQSNKPKFWLKRFLKTTWSPASKETLFDLLVCLKPKLWPKKLILPPKSENADLGGKIRFLGHNFGFLMLFALGFSSPLISLVVFRWRLSCHMQSVVVIVPYVIVTCSLLGYLTLGNGHVHFVVIAIAQQPVSTGFCIFSSLQLSDFICFCLLLFCLFFY